MGKENLPLCVRKFKEVYSEVFAMSKFSMRSFKSEETVAKETVAKETVAMELVTEVQVHSEQSVEDEVQKTLRMIHRVMASNASKTNNNANNKTTTAPTTVTSTPTKTPTTTESKAKTKQTEAVTTTTTPMKDSSDNKEKGGKTPPEGNNAKKGHVSSANSIEQLLNDTVSHKKTTMSTSTSTTENSNKDIDTTTTAATTDDKSDAVNSDMSSEHDEAEEVQSTASAGTPAGSSCKSACAMETSTAQGEMTNTITIGEVKIKQEPVDEPAGGAAVVVGEEGGVVTGIPPNAILTEPGPSEVQDIRSMLPPVVPGLPSGAPTIPSRGPGIRHRYTMVKSAPPPDTWVCEVCQSELASQKHLQTHKLCHFNTSHVCYACDTYFVHSDTLVMHMATLHRDLNPAGQTAIDDGLVCSVCLQRFSSQNNLAKHHNVHMLKDGKSCACRVCGVDFPGARALMTHLGCSGHLAMKVKMQSVFVCVDCRCVFSSRDSYAMHMMMRAQDEVCKGAFSSEGADIILPSGHVTMAAQPAQVQHGDAVTMGTQVSPLAAGIPQVHQNTTSGGQLLFTQQQQQEMMQSLPIIMTSSQVESPLGAPPVPPPDGASSPLNLSTHNSSGSGSGSPGSDTRSVSAVINACSLCPSQFPTQDALALHMMYHAQGGGVGVGAGSNANAYHQQHQQQQQQDVSAVFGRPNSAPLSGGAGVGVGVGMKASGPSPWMCGKCLYSFDTCDTLAMHMMTKHANDHDANNLAVLQAAATQRHGAAMMASAAEIAQNVVQCVVQSMSGNVMQQQLQLQQQQQLQLQQIQQQQEQQPVFPRPQGVESQQLQAAAVKRPLSEDAATAGLQHEFKKRKSSQPMKKQWHCTECDRTYPTKPEYDEHTQFCKASRSSTPNTNPEGEGAGEPHCALCDVTFTDMKSLGTHLRNPVHQHKLKQAGMVGGAGGGGGVQHQRACLGSAGEETDGDKSVGYYSGSRSDSSSLSVYSDQGGASLSPAFSDANQDSNKMTPLNLITDADNSNNNQNYSSSSNRKARNKRASRVPSNALSPESSSQQQNQYNNSNSTSNNKASSLSSSSSSPTERATPVQVPGHVSQSGLSPSGEEEEEENDQDDEASEVMEFLTSRAKDLVMCKHCKIVYTDKTLYHLHMGLHNLNNQWQCNMCGKQCRNLHEFTSHVIHIKI